MKALNLSALLLLLFAFIIALVETANLAPALPVVSFVYAILILAFFAGIFGLSMSVIRCVVSRRFYIVFVMFMLLCMAPMISVHHIVPIDLRLAASNDVSTDIVTPPVFSQSEDVRRLAFPSKFKFFEMQRRVSQYPFGQSLKLKRSCNAAYLRVLSTCSNLGWPI